jgi:transglutaminase-like putative cysteine protease
MSSFTIHHITRYAYDLPVKESVSQVRIYPVVDAWQQVKQFELRITGSPHVATFSDYHGNQVGEFSLLEPHRDLSIDSRFTVQTLMRPAQDFQAVFPLASLPAAIAQDVYLLILATPEKISGQAAVQRALDSLPWSDRTVSEAAWLCSEHIYSHFSYVKGITDVETTVDEILEHQSGVCQDFAHVMLQMLRTLGIPARYVSGYICPNRSGLRGEGATHAWVEFYQPDTGWLGIDPTNNVWVNGHHVRLASGMHFADCTPVKGTFRGVARQALSVYVSVGYEDGHQFEEMNEVQLHADPDSSPAPWQYDWMQAQQQQQ